MLNLNEFKIMGLIKRIGELKQPSYSMIEILVTTESNRKNPKSDAWEKIEKEVAIIFFGKEAEALYKEAHEGDHIFVMGEVQTRFNKAQNGNEYPNTSIQGKKFEIIKGNIPENKPSRVSQKQLDTFEDDIPF